MRKYIDVPNKEVRDQIVKILGKENISYDRYSTPECNYIDSGDYNKIKHILDFNDSIEEKKSGKYKGDAVAEFKAFLESHGIFLNVDPIMDGKKQSLTGQGKKVWGQYCGYKDSKPNGWFRDFTSGAFERCDFNGEMDGNVPVSKAEIAQKNYDKFLEDAERYREVGKKAYDLFQSKQTEKISTEYTTNKKVKIFNARITSDDKIMVPIKSIDGYFTQLQFIDSKGNKKLLGSGKVIGSFYQMGYINQNSKIILCEGWATGSTLHEHLRHPTVCAINSVNLVHVAKVLKKRYPNHEFIIAADNDRFQKNAKENINWGVEKAKEAKKILGAKAIIATPEFDDSLYSEEQHDLIDWNDFYREYGLADFLKELEKLGVKAKRVRKS